MEYPRGRSLCHIAMQRRQCGNAQVSKTRLAMASKRWTEPTRVGRCALADGDGGVTGRSGGQKASLTVPLRSLRCSTSRDCSQDIDAR